MDYLDYLLKAREQETRMMKHQATTVTKLYSLCANIIASLPDEDTAMLLLTKLNQIYDQELANIAEIVEFYENIQKEK